MSETISWGILGTGGIARRFAEALQSLPDARRLAVGSRSAEKAAAFAEQFGLERPYGSYEELAADPDVDAVYIATLNPWHAENALMCLQAGKAVLCEKPFCINVAEAQTVIDYARAEKLFLMEAMWTRCLPVTAKVREWLELGHIGEVRLLAADFGFRAAWNPHSRALDPHLGGGSLLDVGVYCVALATMVFGRPPANITGMADIGETGVDEQAAFILGYDQGELAVLTSAVRTPTPDDARLDGTLGRIRIEHFWRTTAATLEVTGQEPQRVAIPYRCNGYEYEALEVMNCLREGKLESDLMPLDETLTVLRIMDDIRRQWGLVYPQEEIG
jgi:predicted dehydrogenase